MKLTIHQRHHFNIFVFAFTTLFFAFMTWNPIALMTGIPYGVLIAIIFAPEHALHPNNHHYRPLLMVSGFTLLAVLMVVSVIDSAPSFAIGAMIGHYQAWPMIDDKYH